MSVPTSGPVSIASLTAEFLGGSSLGQFYRGGGLVPNVPQNNGVPTSGPISLGAMRGSVRYIPMTVSIVGNVGSTTSTFPQTPVFGWAPTVTDGQGPYSYSWVIASADIALAASPNDYTTTGFYNRQATGPIRAVGQTYTVTAILTVTDATGASVSSLEQASTYRFDDGTVE